MVKLDKYIIKHNYQPLLGSSFVLQRKMKHMISIACVKAYTIRSKLFWKSTMTSWKITLLSLNTLCFFLYEGSRKGIWSNSWHRKTHFSHLQFQKRTISPSRHYRTRQSVTKYHSACSSFTFDRNLTSATYKNGDLDSVQTSTIFWNWRSTNQKPVFVMGNASWVCNHQ